MAFLSYVSGVAHSCRRYFLALSVALLFAGNAAAQNIGTIFTDLWYTVGEDGWGVTIDHQQNVMFLTFFVYGADRSPHWVTAVLTKVGTNGLLAPPQVFAGNVYEDHGPWFGGPFDSATVVEATVGTATFTAPTALGATLRYSINGVEVTKNIQRETLSLVNYSSSYGGGTAYTLSNCQNPAQNGTVITDTGTLNIIQSGAAFQMTTAAQRANCAFTGTYSQQGLIGKVDGTFECTDTTRGSFRMFFMQWTLFGMSAGIQLQSQFCSAEGFLGGITGNHTLP